MIRFMPDNWVDVVMRPFDMVSPERNVYVEIAAPDIRMAAVVVLSVLVLLFWRRLSAPGRPVMALLVLLILAMPPWLYTTGNGRYFIPFLLLIGPLCIGLLRLLPVTPSFRLTLAGLLVAIQVFFLTEAVPWQKWSWSAWREAPYFQVDRPPAEGAVNYVTVASISYSLIAPQFPPQAGWTSLADDLSGPREQAARHRFLGSGRPLVLVAPSIPSQTLADGQPTAAMRQGLTDLLFVHGLSLRGGRSCELLRSEGLARATPRGEDPDSQNAPVGFWLCPLAYDPNARHQATSPPQVDAMFEAVEQLCPRFFRPGEARSQRIAAGYMRSYTASDTKVYVFDSGVVMYKYWRTLNAGLIGTHDEVLSGRAQVDCTKIRAPNWRKGGP